MSDKHHLSTRFFHDGNLLFSISGTIIPSVRKGQIVYLKTENHTERSPHISVNDNRLMSRKWKVVSVDLSVVEQTFNNKPTEDYHPFHLRVTTTSTLEVSVMPYRYWTIGLRKDRGKFLEVSNEGRFIRFWFFYVGFGYILQ